MKSNPDNALELPITESMKLDCDGTARPSEGLGMLASTSTAVQRSAKHQASVHEEIIFLTRHSHRPVVDAPHPMLVGALRRLAGRGLR